MRFAKTPFTLGCLALLVVFGAAVTPAQSADREPLRPVDTSSPRATLQGFSDTLDEVYLGMAGMIRAYGSSGRLYPDPERRHDQQANLSRGMRAAQFLDTSQITPVLRTTVAAERSLQLKEILDRIDLPAFAEIPDRDGMAKSAAKRWRLPNTEIDIVEIESGPRAGEFLVSAETVDRLPEFYARVRDLPYKTGPAEELVSAYRSISSDRIATIYDAFVNSPVALGMIVPPRWIFALPGWTKLRFAELTVWQWFGFAFGLTLGGLLVFGAYRLSRRLGKGRRSDGAVSAHMLLLPLAVIAVTELLVPALDIVLRISGTPRVITEFGRTIGFYAGAAWLVLIGSGMLGRAIVSSERMNRRSLDSQLIRLSTRFAGIVVATGLLMQAATELGFPAYSVIAGLGVGGLAVALAARDSLANLLGSILIMFERPFRIGHRIRVAGSEGTVEDVGFRSTRIRTPDNSLISIPNNSVVNATVENLSLRDALRQRLVIQVAYETPVEKIEPFILAVRQLIADNACTKKENIHVRLNEFGENSLNILMIFHLLVPDYASELEEREKILLEVMALAKRMAIEFAAPTPTVQVEAVRPEPRPAPAVQRRPRAAARPRLVPTPAP